LTCITLAGVFEALNQGLPHQEIAMNVFKDLFTTNERLMSIIGLTFMLGMGVLFVRYMLKHMALDAAQAKRSGP
jgi:Protein of unknown function (DUF3149)